MGAVVVCSCGYACVAFDSDEIWFWKNIPRLVHKRTLCTYVHAVHICACMLKLQLGTCAAIDQDLALPSPGQEGSNGNCAQLRTAGASHNETHNLCSYTYLDNVHAIGTHGW